MLNLNTGRRDGLGALLACDVATSFGWACVHEDGAIASGRFDLSLGVTPGHEGRRFLNLRAALINFRAGLPRPDVPVRVFYEDVMFGSGGAQTQLAAQVFGGYKAILLSWCETHGYRYDGVHVGTWKKYVVGNGHATKADVMAAVRALGHQPKSEDEADALGVLYYALGAEKNERLLRAVR